MRRAARTDENQPQIVKDLRDLGFSVAITAAVGNGFPDIAVGTSARNYFFEIKDPNKPKADRQLTPAQKQFFASWKGQVRKVETLEEILQVIRESYK